MINQPFEECLKICDYLKINRSKTEIEEAILRQSFEQKKAEFERQGDMQQVKFMRAGKTQQWKKQLNQKQKDKFIDVIGELLVKLGYEI